MNDLDEVLAGCRELTIRVAHAIPSVTYGPISSRDEQSRKTLLSSTSLMTPIVLTHLG
jgi:hypothetical protein